MDLWLLFEDFDLAAFAVGFEGNEWCTLVMVNGITKDLEIRTPTRPTAAHLRQTIKGFINAN